MEGREDERKHEAAEELERQLSPLRIGQRTLDSDRLVEPGDQGKNSWPVLIDINMLVQMTVQVDVLGYADVLVEPGISSRRIDERSRPEEDHVQRDEVRGQSEWRQLALANCQPIEITSVPRPT